MVKERNHNGDSYLLIDLDLERNETLLHEALTWYPSCLWYQKKLFEAGLFSALFPVRTHLEFSKCIPFKHDG